MARSSDARPNAIATTERLVRLKGAAATGLAEIIEQSGAPKGSFYFHFPGGKQQLLLEMLVGYAARGLGAINWASRTASGDPVRLVILLCSVFGDETARDGFRYGCALQALTDEWAASEGEAHTAIAAHTQNWLDALDQAFADCGLGQADARATAFALLSALQGARTVARALKSREPFDAVARHFGAVLGD